MIPRLSGHFFFIWFAKSCSFVPTAQRGEGGGGGYSGFQVTGITEWAKNKNPPKIPRVSNKSQKNRWTKI